MASCPTKGQYSLNNDLDDGSNFNLCEFRLLENEYVMEYDSVVSNGFKDCLIDSSLICLFT